MATSIGHMILRYSESNAIAYGGVPEDRGCENLDTWFVTVDIFVTSIK